MTPGEIAVKTPWGEREWRAVEDLLGPVLWPQLQDTVVELTIVAGGPPAARAYELLNALEHDSL